MLRRTLLPPKEAMRFSIQPTAMRVASRPASHFSAAPSHLGVFVRDPFTFDDEGQLFDRSGTAFTFDDEHRLVTAGGDTYTYDGVGNRLQATRGGTVTRYVYDASGNLLAEANGSNQILRYYVYGQGLLAMVTPSGASYSYHYDATGNTVAMTDGSQAVVNRYAYTPYGQIVGKAESVPQPFQYVGQSGVMAEPNGFYYMRARYYDPEVGRFVSEDPIGFEGGDVNLYAYVGGNPVMGIDPSGLDSYRQNRLLSMFDSTGIATQAPLTHTFIYTTNPDKTLEHTYSWGNGYEKNKGQWFIDADIDMSAAQQAISNPDLRGERIGGEALDSHIDKLAREWKTDPNHASKHANWIIFRNCKSEATRLTREAKASF